MPTTITKVIGTGGDYTTIQAWEDATSTLSTPNNLVASDVLYVGECKNQTFSESVTIAGQTTDATRYIHLKCQSGASFSDQAGVRTTALRYNTANGMALAGNIPLTLSTNYTRVTGLQIDNNSGYGTGIDITGSVTNCLITKCIIQNGGGSFTCIVSRHASNIFANCLVEDAAAANGGVMSQGEFHSCTIICNAASPSGTGATSGYSSLKLINCAVFGFGTAYSGTAASGSGYNASDSATTYGSNNQSSLTYANQFVSSSNDYRAVDTGSLDLNGTPDPTYASDDISGTARSATTPTIGCWEVVAAGGTTMSIAAYCINTNKYQGICRAI